MRLKNLFIFCCVARLLTACSTTRHSASTTTSSNSSGNNTQLAFLDNITINPGRETNPHTNVSTAGSNAAAGTESSASHVTESYSALQFKYAILLNIPVEELNNPKLLQFMDEWYGIRYHYGGDSKEGIDCSAFVYLMMSNVYALNSLPRVSKEQYLKSRRIDRQELREGDLVFFHTVGRHKTVSHVGVYLTNNKFIHASSSGVMISDLGEAYYARRYVGAGRVLD